MKIRRHKHTKRVLKFYKTNFNYEVNKQINVLIDGTFAHEALNSKVNLADQLPKFFDLKPTNCKLLTTKCAIRETELLGKATHGAMMILKQYELTECKHKREFVNAEKCIKNILIDQINRTAAKTSPSSSSRDDKFFVATQSESLKNVVRSLNGIPLLVISHKALNLERPSEMTVNQVAQRTESKLKPKEIDLNRIKKLKEHIEKKQQTTNNQQKVHKKKVTKGPNPLSCLRKKKRPKQK